jgi:hypothetical protein
MPHSTRKEPALVLTVCPSLAGHVREPVSTGADEDLVAGVPTVDAVELDGIGVDTWDKMMLETDGNRVDDATVIKWAPHAAVL